MNIIKLYERLERIERLLLFRKKVLNIEEASEVTGYKISYLYKLTSLKEIPHSKPNKGSVFFEKEKLESWMLRNEVKCKQDLESEALAYTLNRKRQ